MVLSWNGEGTSPFFKICLNSAYEYWQQCEGKPTLRGMQWAALKPVNNILIKLIAISHCSYDGNEEFGYTLDGCYKYALGGYGTGLKNNSKRTESLDSFLQEVYIQQSLSVDLSKEYNSPVPYIIYNNDDVDIRDNILDALNRHIILKGIDGYIGILDEIEKSATRVWESEYRGIGLIAMEYLDGTIYTNARNEENRLRVCYEFIRSAGVKISGSIGKELYGVVHTDLHENNAFISSLKASIIDWGNYAKIDKDLSNHISEKMKSDMKPDDFEKIISDLSIAIDNSHGTNKCKHFIWGQSNIFGVEMKGYLNDINSNQKTIILEQLCEYHQNRRQYIDERQDVIKYLHDNDFTIYPYINIASHEQPPADTLCPNEDIVIIYGVKTRPELNGTVAVCKEYITKSGRWKIMLNDKTNILVKPSNLLPYLEKW